MLHKIVMYMGVGGRSIKEFITRLYLMKSGILIHSHGLSIVFQPPIKIIPNETFPSQSYQMRLFSVFYLTYSRFPCSDWMAKRLELHVLKGLVDQNSQDSRGGTEMRHRILGQHLEAKTHNMNEEKSYTFYIKT